LKFKKPHQVEVEESPPQFYPLMEEASCLPLGNDCSDRIPCDSDVSEDDLNDQFEQSFITKGRWGEYIINQKSQVADTVAVLIAFIVSFPVSEILGLESASFNCENYLIAFIFALVASISCGLFSLTLFVYLSAKVKRLTGRSAYSIGFGDCDKVEDLVSIIGKEKWKEFKLKFKYDDFAKARGNKFPHFHVRKWYYDFPSPGSWFLPQSSFNYGLNVFVLMLVLFLSAIFIRILDILSTFDDTYTSAIVAITSSGLLFLGLVSSLYISYTNGAMDDLA